jgi:hypothetical protein
MAEIRPAQKMNRKSLARALKIDRVLAPDLQH